MVSADVVKRTLHWSLWRLARSQNRAAQWRGDAARIPPVALQPVSHNDPSRSCPVGRRCCTSDPLVRVDRRYVCDFVHEYTWITIVAQLLYRLLPRAEWRSDSHRYLDPKYDELRDRIWVSFEKINKAFYHLEAYISCSITPWVQNLGLQNAFVIAALVGLLQALSFLIMIKFGYRLRKASLARYRTYAGEMIAAGLVH